MVAVYEAALGFSEKFTEIVESVLPTDVIVGVPNGRNGRTVLSPAIDWPYWFATQGLLN